MCVCLFTQSVLIITQNQHQRFSSSTTRNLGKCLLRAYRNEPRQSHVDSIAGLVLNIANSVACTYLFHCIRSAEQSKHKWPEAFWPPLVRTKPGHQLTWQSILVFILSCSSYSVWRIHFLLGPLSSLDTSTLFYWNANEYYLRITKLRDVKCFIVWIFSAHKFTV